MAGPVEIVCDESGYEGDRLVGSTTALFAHASVLISEAEAAAILAELRRRIRSPATQYKAIHLLRTKHRDVLEWFLGPDAPLRGRASVFVVDKTHYVLGRVVELLLGDGTLAPAGPAARPETDLLHRRTHRSPASTMERRLPEAANELLRRRGSAVPFFTALAEIRSAAPMPPRANTPLPPRTTAPLTREAMTPEAAAPLTQEAAAPLTPEAAAPLTPKVEAPPTPETATSLTPKAEAPLTPETATSLAPEVDALLERLSAGVARAEAYRAALTEDPEAASAAVDPLTPAILAAVNRWDAGHGVTLAHDRQRTLSTTRVARLREWSDGRLTAVRFLIAEDEPRIQLADILAGTVRALLPTADAALARPFVDPSSLLPPAA